ncbi:MAG TPA: nodulation protein NfeD, partial [Thermoanaerobaculia bacterium]|nr:nodulation protein NfeD [Thermoanaerobaculia bacterium]
KKTVVVSAFLLFVAAAALADITHVVVDSVIHPMSEEFIGRAIDTAATRHSSLVIIELRTPGGLETSTRLIIEKILKSRVPVAVYIAPSGARAASAGFFILEAADIAAMAPGTNTGAAHPVILGGGKMDDVMKMKMQNDSAAWMRTIAQRRGRNVAVAESGVREAKSFTETEALSQNLINVIAPSNESLVQWADGKTIKRFDGSTAKLHLTGQSVTEYNMSLRQHVLTWIMDPNVAFILLSLGMLAIYAEFNHPGAIVPGVIGGISILLSVFALNLLPTSFAAIALLLAAFILFALEAKYTSYGVLGIGGVICLVLGGVLLVDGPIPEMRVRPMIAIVVGVPFGIIAVFLMSLVLKARRHRVVTGSEAMVGEIGVAQTFLGPEGKVFVHGELWNASAKNEIPEGARVRVRAVNGLRLMVEPAD